MSAVVDIVGGKAYYDGRSLADWVDAVAQRIHERCRPVDVIVFGSVARGDDGPDSDIDLLVVMTDIKRRHAVGVGVLRELRDLPVPVDIIVVDPATMERERDVPGVVRVALREGRSVRGWAA
jgi:predicted nucleotidyltransferase